MWTKKEREREREREREAVWGRNRSSTFNAQIVTHFLIIMVGLLYDPAFCLFLLLYILYEYIRVMIDAKG